MAKAMTPRAMPMLAVPVPGCPLRLTWLLASIPSPMAIGPRMTPNASSPASAQQQRGDGVAVALEDPSTHVARHVHHDPSLPHPTCGTLISRRSCAVIAVTATTEVDAHAEAHLRDGWGGQLARQGPHGVVARPAAQAAGAAGHPAEARPVHQRRSGHDEPVRARRGVRHRRRRRDRPRPRPLRAVHRREPDPRRRTPRPGRSTSPCWPPSDAATTSARRSRSSRTSPTRSSAASAASPPTTSTS